MSPQPSDKTPHLYRLLIYILYYILSLLKCLILPQKDKYSANNPEYTLPFTKSALFNKGFLRKVLNPPQEDNTKPRTVNVYCTFRIASKLFII